MLGPHCITVVDCKKWFDDIRGWRDCTAIVGQVQIIKSNE